MSYEYSERELANRYPAQGITIVPGVVRGADVAFWVERRDGKTFVSISSADVTSTVTTTMEGDQLAYDRGIATAGKPILPRTYVEDRFNLSITGGRPAITVTAVLEDNLHLRTDLITIRPTVLENVGTWNYDNFILALTQNRTAMHLDELARGLSQRRQSNGAASLYNAREGFYVTENDGRFYIDANQYRAFAVVEELRILADRAAAEYAYLKGMPFIYRNQISPSSETERLESAAQLVRAQRDQDWALIESLQRKIGAIHYGIQAAQNSGLGVPRYGHFTLPFQRYASWVNHRLWRTFHEEQAFPYSREELQRMSANLDRSLRAARATREVAKDRRDLPPVSRILRAGEPRSPAARKTDATDEPLTAILLQIANGQMNNRQLFEILTRPRRNVGEWEVLRNAVLNNITVNTAMASSMVNYANHAFPDIWKRPVFAENMEGSGFSYIVDLEIVGQRTLHVEGPMHPTKQAARTAAYTALWYDFAGVPFDQEQPQQPAALPPEPQVPVQYAPAETITANERIRITARGRNPLEIINEFYQLARIAKPVERSKETGPPNNPVFDCSMKLTLRNEQVPIVARATAGKKNVARAEAAKAMLEKLQQHCVLELIS